MPRVTNACLIITTLIIASCTNGSWGFGLKSWYPESVLNITHQAKDSSIEPSFARVYGTVRDKEHKDLILFAKITLLNTQIATTTDMSGNFTMTLPVGQHELHCSYSGYRSLYIKKFRVEAGTSYECDIQLSVQILE